MDFTAVLVAGINTVGIVIVAALTYRNHQIIGEVKDQTDGMSKALVAGAKREARTKGNAEGRKAEAAKGKVSGKR